MHINNLEQEILRSDIVRVKLLAGFFIFFAIYAALWVELGSRNSELLIQNHLSRWMPTVLLLLFALYYMIQLRFLLNYQKRGKSVYVGLKFLSIFLEITIPSCVLLFFFQYHPPLYVFFSARTSIYYIFIILSALTLDYRMCLFAGIISAIEYTFLGSYFVLMHNFSETGSSNSDTEQVISRGLMYLIAGFVTAFVTHQIKKNIFSAAAAAEEREKIAHVFGRHVSPEVVSMLLSQKKNELIEQRFVGVLFLDIRNFTSYSENKNPEIVVNYLNKLFSLTIEIINKNHGIINKFLGDGFMAVFGAPLKTEHDIDNAVKAAEEIIIEIDRAIANKIIPATRVGIGIHCGLAVTGTVGDDQRQEYTIIGDVVNLASRVEQLNKNYQSQLLISADVYKHLKEPRGELLGEAVVPGRQQAITIYRLK